jgi:hypothetical protein
MADHLDYRALPERGTGAAEPDVRALKDGQRSPPATIEAVRWLEGRWRGEGLGGQVEESYASAAGGGLAGHFQLARAGKPAFYEFVLIRERDGSLVYQVKHFGPDGRAWEERDRWIEFPLVAVEGDRVFFSGLTLERSGADAFQAHLRMQDRATGRRWIETFRFRRVRG